MNFLIYFTYILNLFAFDFYSLIINESLDYGTQIPYIRKGINKGYGVIVLNTNDNFTLNGKKIPKSGTAEEHALYVWETYIAKTNADSILIVAHSYGGVVTLALADKTNDFEKRVKAVAFTDSVHAYSNNKVPNYLLEVCFIKLPFNKSKTFCNMSFNVI